MKVSYDPKTDTMSVIFKEGSAVFESDEDKPGVILDYDADGNLVSLRDFRCLHENQRNTKN